MILPEVVGHRGAAAHAPENTLAGIRCAADFGIGAVEVDVKLTADDQLILIHDPRVDRTTDGAGAVAEMTWAQLRVLDAGAWFGAAFAATPIPTLAAAIAEILALNLQANLEIKPCPGREAETALAMVAAIRALWPGDVAPPLLSSYALAALEIARQAAPELPRAVLMRTGSPQDWCAATQRVGAVALHGKAASWTPTHVAAMKAEGLACGCYTVNEAEQALTLRRMGLDYVITDDPAPIAAALADL